MSRASSASGLSTPSRGTLSRQTSSPLRPNSPPPVRSFSDATLAVGSRRASTPNAAALLNGPAQAPTPPPAGKSRARDLLRKHYGLGVGPPPSGQAKIEADPMDLGKIVVRLVCFILTRDAMM